MKVPATTMPSAGNGHRAADRGSSRDAGWWPIRADGRVKQFEAELGQFLGARFVRGVNTGTDALVVALRALASALAMRSSPRRTRSTPPSAPSRWSAPEPVLVDRRSGDVPHRQAAAQQCHRSQNARAHAGSTCTGSPHRWPRSSRSPRRMASSSSKMPRRRSARGSKGSRWRRSGHFGCFSSIRAETSRRPAMAERWWRRNAELE